MGFVKQCFDYAKENDWKLKVTCPYMKGPFLKKYATEYKQMVVEPALD